MSTQAAKSGAAWKPRIGDEGTLSDLPLPTLLLDLYRVRFNGVLEIERGNTSKRVTMQHGAPLLSESNLASETLGVQLMDQGAITREDHERVSQYMQKKKCKEGVALLALELLTPKALFLALKEQVRRRIVEAFAWSDGQYRLCKQGDLDSVVKTMRSDPLSLIREGLVSHWTPDRLLADLTDFVEQFPVRTKDFDEAQRRLAHDESVAAVCDRIDGTRTLGAAIGSGFNSLEVLATIWILAVGKLVRFEPTAISDGNQSDSDARFDRIEIEVVAKEAPRTRTVEKASAVSAEDADAASKALDAAEVMRQEVLSLVEGLAKRNLYELIGVAPNATTAEIRKAYFAAAKRFHPDALTHLGLADIKQQAAAVFARIAEANEVLRDPTKRAAYDARGATGDQPDIDTAALGQAETFYRKGEILIRMGDFRGALEYLESAVELWPDECAYQSALGWALYKQAKPDAERARTHLEKAIELDDSDAVSLFRLGTVLRAMGDEGRASECLARAKILDPKAS